MRIITYICSHSKPTCFGLVIRSNTLQISFIMHTTNTILQDDPIQDESQDELGRVSMVELIANSIIKYSKNTHPCTNIGIYGPWGCGKTSMINLIQNHLINNGKKDNISIVHFNPWQTGSMDLLMSEFFKCICKDFEEEVRDFIKKYGDIISFAASMIPVVGWQISEGIKNAKDMLASSENTLKEQKDKISEAIIKSKKHLVVFIDDLDRLDKEELHAVFRLIRQVADFKNTMYVVAMDVDMAAKSISQYYGGDSGEDGRRFIDKIIQVPINIPIIQKPYLKNHLSKLMRDIIKPYKDIGEDDIDAISEKVSNLFETKRDCIRFVNQLGFVFPSVAEEVNVHDFCLIEAIKVISQEAYMKILYNKNALLRIPDTISFPYIDNKDADIAMDKRFQEALENITKDLTAHNIGNKIKNLLENDLFYFNSTDPFQLIDQQKLQSNVYFDKYFVMAVPEHLIPDSEMDRLHSKILSMSHKDLSKWINKKCDRYSYEEIQRATLRVIRKFDDDNRCKATQLFCEALSISELAKRYKSNVYNQKQTDVFVTNTLIPRYMVRAKETDMGMTYEVDTVLLDKTLLTIYQEADFNYCMQIHYGVNNLHVIKAHTKDASFDCLKTKFISMSFDEQMKFHRELLTSYYSYWECVDAKEMTMYLTKLINQSSFQTDVFINKFITYNGDATVIDTFVRLFKNVVLLLVGKIEADGRDYSKESPVRLFMANYKEALRVS